MWSWRLGVLSFYVFFPPANHCHHGHSLAEWTACIPQEPQKIERQACIYKYLSSNMIRVYSSWYIYERLEHVCLRISIEFQGPLNVVPIAVVLF